MKTLFNPIPGTPEGVQLLLEKTKEPLVIVSRHGLGDNVFFSPCFPALKRLFPEVCFCSSVNAYASIFHDSPYVKVLYHGGLNGADLGLGSPEGFCNHFHRLGLDIGHAQANVYHYGLFEPSLPYSDERAFVKGRRNYVELFQTGLPATETPQYLLAPDALAGPYVSGVVDRWLPERRLIVIGRYGHTDPDKNFGDGFQETLSVVDRIENECPGRYKFISLDYSLGDNSADGRRFNLRSVYGFLSCDSSTLHHLLQRACLLITVPSGPMLVGASIPTLKLLTLWKTMPPYHFLDPQFDGENPAYALLNRQDLASRSFMDSWGAPSRNAVDRRWKISVESITPESVANHALKILET